MIKQVAIINKNAMLLQGIIYTWQGNQQLSFYEFYSEMQKTYVFYALSSIFTIFMPVLNPATVNKFSDMK